MSTAPFERQPERSSVRGTLVLACVCAAAFVLVWCVAELVPAVSSRDAVALHDFTLLGGPRVDGIAKLLLSLLKPLLFVMWGAAIVLVALARNRPRSALAILALLVLAPLTSEALKRLLAHPRTLVDTVHVNPASWPSGHSTAALTLVFAAVLAAPPRLRPLVAWLGAAFAVAVGCSLLILALHMPSDVLGGYLVATFWAALVLAAVRFAASPR